MVSTEEVKRRLEEKRKRGVVEPSTPLREAPVKCPVCRKMCLTPFTKKKLFGTIEGMRCSNCGAVFRKKGEGYLLHKTSNRNSNTWRLYGGKTLTEEEWIRIANGGVSNEIQRKNDLENWLESARAGKVKFIEPESPIILKRNENAVFILDGIDLYEPRAVRRTRGLYGGPTIKVSKNVSFRMGGLNARSESHEELKRIDTGTLIITTRRMVFIGTKRTTNIDLKKVFAIQPYRDGIAVRRENKKRTEHFLNTDKVNLEITQDGRNYSVQADGTILKAVIEGLIRNL